MSITLQALSVRQPHANRIRDGAKTIEVRRWATDYRGELLIVSSRRPAIPPAGQALALVELVDCRPMRLADRAAASCEAFPAGSWAWILDRIRPLVAPFPVTGQLGIYEVDLPARPACRSG